MSKAIKYTAYPLSATLTRRVVNYLNIYRLIIAAVLAIAYFSGLLSASMAPQSSIAATLVLVFYFLFAAFHLISARREDANFFRVAVWSLFSDIFSLSLLVVVFAGIGGGLGILLVFASAVAAVLLPLRLALLLASFASLAMVGTGLWSFYFGNGTAEAMLQAAFFSVTAMVSTIMANQLAYWARDYRLIAEKQKETLTELEQVNELIIRRMRTGVIAVDETGLIRVMNESAWFALGSPSVRERSLKSITPRLAKALDEWKNDTTSDPRPVVLEPSQAQVLPGFVALPGNDGIGAMIFLTDNNVVARRAVELSVNSLAKLSGSIAHEIRNPLAALNHASQLLEESPQIRLPEMRLINIIQNHAKRMNGIIENILQLSRREQSQPELVPLHLFLPEFASEFQSSQVNRQLDFKAAVQLEEETYVLYDKSQLSQCLWKLLDNAVDHASRDRSKPSVRLALARHEESGFCIITVADNGPGINKEQLSKIFEPFYTTRKEGSGLGLYIAKQLCEANQAELTVDSEPGSGAFFHIRLALAHASAKQ
ncbi:MAG: HAMP domain-containing histidine kinase [Xanthomonadales bacterium]|nr:HAMP domain-containing histidine kinase [Gammaproteobacteria bacterium]MBT8053085.1 HAMP domain-containing histidine kinase [Gammaproteobacteria bacterium]NND56671.1 HAMP domain-containing histidine kinase [Xanthomonadales bacterium]NNK52656.1 HAMP domain-containing histidine kinase [Xanthomonadales bacterium]